MTAPDVPASWAEVAQRIKDARDERELSLPLYGAWLTPRLTPCGNCGHPLILMETIEHGDLGSIRRELVEVTELTQRPSTSLSDSVFTVHDQERCHELQANRHDENSAG